MKHFILDHVKLNASLLCFHAVFFMPFLYWVSQKLLKIVSIQSCIPPPTTNNFMSDFLVGKKKPQRETKQVLI